MFVEALYHIMRLRPFRLEAVLDAMSLALLFEVMAPVGLTLICPREAISERLAFVGQHCLNLRGRLILQCLTNIKVSLAN